MTTDHYDFSELEASLTLSTHALSALHEFLAEKKEADEAFNALARKPNMTKTRSGGTSRSQTPPSAVSDAATSSDEEGESENDFDNESDEEEDDDEPRSQPSLTMAAFKEDWQLSQFWYDDETARTMGDEMVRRANGGMIVCNLGIPNPLVLLEIDTRFAVFPEYKYYDYTRPLDVDGLEEGGKLRGAAAAVIVDPPFLNEDTVSKSSETVNALCGEGGSILVSTGWTVRNSIKRHLNASIAKFRPRHKGGLANAFRCYVNYVSDAEDFSLSTDTEDGDNDFSEESA